MDRRVLFVSFGLTGGLSVGIGAAGQHEGHQAGATAAPSAAQVSDCRQAQPVIAGLLIAALKRLEDARLANSAAAMRDAADDVQGALVDVRTQLAPCSVMQSAPMAPAAQAAPAATGTPAAAITQATQPTPAAPVAPDPHAGHAVPAAPPASTTPSSPSSAARPSAPARPAPPQADDAHAGHATPPASAPAVAPGASGGTAAAPPTSLAELKCSNAVDPKTAPRMLYQGRMYYFCTEADRAAFARDPAKVVTAPPQAGPAHAH